MTHVAIVDAKLLAGIISQLQQPGHTTVALTDSASLNAWLSEHEAAVLLLGQLERRKAAIPTATRVRRKTDAHWSINPVRLELVTPGGKVITLSHNECRILCAAARAKKQLVDRKVLIEAMGQNFLHYDERRLEALISRLRRKLSACVSDGFPVKGVKGQGYLFGVKLLEVER
ncbi:MAG: response regulator transcription factor [Nitrosomonadales bacterium]|nr:response regulator transcription factor [Nitrosomonadales bacterium]